MLPQFTVISENIRISRCSNIPAGYRIYRLLWKELVSKIPVGIIRFNKLDLTGFLVHQTCSISRISLHFFLSQIQAVGIFIYRNYVVRFLKQC